MISYLQLIFVVTVYTGLHYHIYKFSNHSDELCGPRSIILDSNDFILVTDTGNHRVMIFDKYGHLIHKFGFRGSGNGEFLSSFEIAVNRNGGIYVSDQYYSRIQIFAN